MNGISKVGGMINSQNVKRVAKAGEVVLCEGIKQVGAQVAHAPSWAGKVAGDAGEYAIRDGIACVLEKFGKKELATKIRHGNPANLITLALNHNGFRIKSAEGENKIGFTAFAKKMAKNPY